MQKRPILLTLLTGTLATIAFSVFSPAQAATPDDLNRDLDAALHMLVTTNPAAANVANSAKAILIFPNIVKAGLIFGGAYGEGELKKGKDRRVLQLRDRLLGLAGRRSILRIRRVPDERQGGKIYPRNAWLGNRHRPDGRGGE